MSKPAKAPIKPGDFHLVVNDKESSFDSEMTLFDSSGKAVWKRPCLAKGVRGSDYSQPQADTPPGLYKAGLLTVTQDWENRAIWNAFGKYFIDMVGTANNEEKYGRSGVGLHGGGSGAPNPLADYQQLCATHGCVRAYNADMEKLIVPVYYQCQKTGNTLWITVVQH